MQIEALFPVCGGNEVGCARLRSPKSLAGLLTISHQASDHWTGEILVRIGLECRLHHRITSNVMRKGKCACVCEFQVSNYVRVKWDVATSAYTSQATHLLPYCFILALFRVYSLDIIKPEQGRRKWAQHPSQYLQLGIIMSGLHPLILQSARKQTSPKSISSHPKTSNIQTKTTQLQIMLTKQTTPK